MARILEPPVVTEEIFEALELLIFGAIGLTSFALAEAAHAELTLHQWRALVVVGRAGRIRVGEAGALIGTSLPSTSRLISRLEKRGYLASGRDETDRRATNVWLTPAGEEVRAAVIRRRRQLMQAALQTHPGPLPRDLVRGLTALAQAFERYT